MAVWPTGPALASSHPQVDVLPVPRERLRELGAPLRWERVHVLAPPMRESVLGSGADESDESDRPSSHTAMGAYALVVARLAPEKGVDVAIDACRIAGMPLVIAGDGPQRAALIERAGDGAVRFAGRVDDGELASLRAGAAIALAPSRAGETFGLAAAEAMAAGLPVAASRVGALSELLEPDALVPAGDPLAKGSAELAANLKEYSRLKYGADRATIEDDIYRRLRE